MEVRSHSVSAFARLLSCFDVRIIETTSSYVNAFFQEIRHISPILFFLQKIILMIAVNLMNNIIFFLISWYVFYIYRKHLLCPRRSRLLYHRISGSAFRIQNLCAPVTEKTQPLQFPAIGRKNFLTLPGSALIMENKFKDGIHMQGR